MIDKLTLIAGFGGMMGAVYWLAMRAAPGRGWLRLMERLCAGIILCYLCHLMLKPLGFTAAQSPLAALSAGYLGLPGVALASVLAYWP